MNADGSVDEVVLFRQGYGILGGLDIGANVHNGTDAVFRHRGEDLVSILVVARVVIMCVCLEYHCLSCFKT